MSYASVSDVRAEGLSSEQASDARITGLLEEASETIDRVCGWWFEPRTTSLTLSGNGNRTLELPIPPVADDAITGIVMNESPLDVSVVQLFGATLTGRKMTLRIDSRSLLYFERGFGNIVITGTFGVLSRSGQTPAAIKRAAVMMALKMAPKLGTQDAVDARNQWRVTTERTRDQEVQVQPRQASGFVLTGDPEVDEVLRPWRRPMGIGSV